MEGDEDEGVEQEGEARAGAEEGGEGGRCLVSSRRCQRKKRAEEAPAAAAAASPDIGPPLPDRDISDDDIVDAQEAKGKRRPGDLEGERREGGAAKEACEAAAATATPASASTSSSFVFALASCFSLFKRRLDGAGVGPAPRVVHGAEHHLGARDGRRGQREERRERERPAEHGKVAWEGDGRGADDGFTEEDDGDDVGALHCFFCFVRTRRSSHQA